MGHLNNNCKGSIYNTDSATNSVLTIQAGSRWLYSCWKQKPWITKQIQTMKTQIDEITNINTNVLSKNTRNKSAGIQTAGKSFHIGVV